VKLGFLTACLPDENLAGIAAWAAGQGYQALEVAAWPKAGNRPFTATHLDVDGLSAEGAEAVNELFARHHLCCSSIAYYDNNLHPDPDERKAVNAHVMRCIDAAAQLGVPSVGTFVGRDPSRTVAENLREAERVFAPIVAHASDRGVRLVIENCVMEGWHPDGYPGQAVRREDPWDTGWWRYRVPGLGDVDWRRLVDVLYEGGFDGVLSVEHEDPVWGGSPERVRTGLQVAFRTLSPLIIA
jgi:sugar phosphate isomerase/epimerase